MAKETPDNPEAGCQERGKPSGGMAAARTHSSPVLRFSSGLDSSRRREELRFGTRSLEPDSDPLSRWSEDQRLQGQRSDR